MRRCMQGGGSSTCAKMKPGAAQSRCVDMAQGSTYAMLWARTPALLGHLRRFASCCARRSQTRQLLSQKLSRRSPVDLGEGSDHCPGAPQSKIRPRRAGSTARAAARALGQPKKASSTRLRRRRDAPGAHEELPSRRRDRGAAGGQLPTSRRRAPWPSSRRRAPRPSASPST